MFHQDFNTIVLRKPVTKKSQVHNGIKEIDKVTKIANDNESVSHKTIGIENGKNIQKARIAKGFKSQKDLANALNIKPNIIVEYENGKAIPDNNILQKLRNLLKIQITL